MNRLAIALLPWVLVSLAGCPPSIPNIVVSDTSHDFGAADTEWSFDVWQETAGSPLSVQITDDSAWLSVAPAADTSDGPDDRVTVAVTVDRAQLPAGTNTGTVTVDGGLAGTRTISITATAPSGTIRVTLSPAGAVGAGAQWRVDGGDWLNSGATSGPLAVGAHDVSFRDVVGWTAPEAIQVAVTAGLVTESGAAYVTQTGIIEVTIGPVDACAAGAACRVDGGAWQDTGAVIELSVGDHTVEFRDLDDWVAPEAMSVTVTHAATAPVSATYTPRPGSLKVHINPEAARAAGAQWRVDGGAWQNHESIVAGLAPGIHQVSFNDIAGWARPGELNVTILSRETAEATGTYSNQSGSVKVKIEPEPARVAGAQWRVDGGAWQAHEAIVSNLAPGNHTVSFSDLAGWTKPNSIAVNVKANETAERTGTYTAHTGSLRVTIEPSAAVQAGAQWRVDGGAWQSSGATLANLGIGVHTVAFKDLPAWATPAPREVTVVTSETAETTGVYTQQSGALHVMIEPAAARDAGAQWRVDGGAWRTSGDTASSLSVGPHTVAFSAVEGWGSPANILVTIVSGQTAEATGTYTQSTGAVRVTIEPEGARTAGAQWRLDGGTWHNSLDTVSGISAGDHVISYRTIATWTAPAPMPVTVVAAQTTHVIGTYSGAQTGNMVVLGYNDLGMHCMNEDFSNLMILPPYNTLHATVIDRSGEEPDIVQSGVTVSYELPDNTTSVTKTNFWDYAPLLFGVSLPDDIGLTGNGLAGTMVSAAAEGRNDWVVTGIPITPLDDSGVENPYSLATITVRKNGIVQAETQAVVPVSWEISCNLCHYAPGVSPDIDILRDHDRMHGTSLESQRPVVCGACHGQPPLGLAGDPTLPTLSGAMHSAHAGRMAQAGLDVSCYACHPGVRTQCLRDVHFAAGMNCMDCHGEMSDVGDPARSPWADEPRCDDCHTRAGYQFEQPGTLFRNSKGHRGIHCAACHGSPHAITPTVTPEDNIQAVLVQGHAGTIDTCSVCHNEVPDDPFPHRVDEDEGGED